MNNELPKAYDPSAIEAKWAKFWVDEHLWDTPAPASDGPAASRFVQLLPPPNVTGRLHMGHMLNQTEMDILARWHRMLGEQSVWVPGTDHAGIATQMMVERQLASEGGPSRRELGREKFLERVWEWKAQYGGAITEQMRRLGASVDWSREYFTMDERLSHAVRESFVRLWEQGLIYRGAYIVNWDPQIQTAVSDLEVVHEERAGKLYHIRYALADGTGSIVIATTRPETMLGDVAVAVNPNDERYQPFIGKVLVLPLVGREIPVVADEWANPEFGTGAVKVTPAHDPNDFAIGQRHHLPQLSIMDEHARINLPDSPYHGMDRFAARERIVEDLRASGQLVDIKDHTHAIALSQRTGVVIEPRLSLQWFLAVNQQPKTGGESIAAKAIAAVREGHITFTPEMYAKTYFEWMNNIHDWCISRQLWWGHRIPAWHCTACNEINVARETPTTCANCGSHELTQETDVLDTWFSSGLLPFTVFGWDGSGKLTDDLRAFYPTDLLVTGFDILFFWVARMIMLGCHLTLDTPLADGSPRTLAESVPFRNVYIHALVRDAERQKMSKTKGNVIDPIEVVTKYGTDAVRFTLASQASPGTDIAFSEARTEGYRAFANKIWNAARFLQLQVNKAKAAGHNVALRDLDTGGILHQCVHDDEQWIVGNLRYISLLVNAALKGYRFDEAAKYIYQFIWGYFCDWYIEIAKSRFVFSGDQAADTDARSSLNIALSVFEQSLRLLSPFMPFITEELWDSFYEGCPPLKSIAFASYPAAEDMPEYQGAWLRYPYLQEMVISLRELRSALGVPEKEFVPCLIHIPHSSTSEDFSRFINRNLATLLKLGKISEAQFMDRPLSGPNTRHFTDFEVAVVYERQIDVPAERERLEKEIARLDKGLQAAGKQLGSESFLAKAPAHIVDGLKKQAAENQALRDKAQAALDLLPTA